ncbi:MAG: PorT family protein [Rikenellaceae bacterium]|nr:PorT family protein [Rikenellaceae bacterium]
MKIRAIVTAIVASMAVTTSATAEGGLIEFGAKAGITTQGVKFSGAESVDPYHKLSTNSRAGFHIGLMSRVNLPLVHLQPELFYSQTSYRLNVAQLPSGASLPSDSYPYKSTVRLKSVDVPIMVGLSVMWFHIQAGPMFTVMSETKLKDRGYISDVAIDKPSVSYLLGIGVDLRRLNFDIRYNGNFKKYIQSILYGTNHVGNDFRSKHKHWMFSVGYLF